MHKFLWGLYRVYMYIYIYIHLLHIYIYTHRSPLGFMEDISIDHGVF